MIHIQAQIHKHNMPSYHLYKSSTGILLYIYYFILYFIFHCSGKWLYYFYMTYMIYIYLIKSIIIHLQAYMTHIQA